MAKTVSLKLDESTYSTTEKIRKQLNLPRNTYIRKAIGHYNSLYARKLWKASMAKCPADWVQHTSNTSKKPNFSRTSPRISDNSDSLEPYRWSMRLVGPAKCDLYSLIPTPRRLRSGSASLLARSLTAFGMTSPPSVISSGSEKSFSTQK